MRIIFLVARTRAASKNEKITISVCVSQFVNEKEKEEILDKSSRYTDLPELKAHKGEARNRWKDLGGEGD